MEKYTKNAGKESRFPRPWLGEAMLHAIGQQNHSICP